MCVTRKTFVIDDHSRGTRRTNHHTNEGLSGRTGTVGWSVPRQTGVETLQPRTRGLLDIKGPVVPETTQEVSSQLAPSRPWSTRLMEYQRVDTLEPAIDVTRDGAKGEDSSSLFLS